MQYILQEIEKQVGYITLNRPEKRNAMSAELVTELKQSFVDFEKDEQVKIIVLKANGKAFCAGADLAYIQKLSDFTYEENLEDSIHLKELFELIYKLKKVVIAEVQGHAIAGGCGLATVCDFVFAVPEAKFGYSEVKIGFVPALVSTFLIDKIGTGKAKEMLLSAKMYNASDACSFNLINFVVEKESLSDTVSNFALNLIKSNSSEAMALTKNLFVLNKGLTLDESLYSLAEKNAKARATDDCKKGIQSFLTKEEIRWD